MGQQDRLSQFLVCRFPLTLPRLNNRRIHDIARAPIARFMRWRAARRLRQAVESGPRTYTAAAH